MQMAGSHTTTAMFLIAASAAPPLATPPLLVVFNQVGLVMALMGALGGLMFCLAIKKPWREAVTPVTLGGGMGFGLGVISPAILKSQLGIDVTVADGAIQSMAASAFIVGVAQERLLRWLVPGEGGSDGPA